MRLTNIASVNNDLYVFARDDNKELKIKRFTGFFPYYFIENASGSYLSYDKKHLKKVLCSKASDVSKAQRFGNIYEGDLRLVKQFMLDKIDVIEPSPIKIAFIDIETQSKELPDVREAPDPISCISVYNSFQKDVTQFYLPDFESEYKMLCAFIAHMKKEKYDLISGWNFVGFDWPYLFNRTKAMFNLSKELSPIGEERYKDGEMTYPCGISIVDYMIYFQKITLNRERQYTLDHIAQKYLGSAPNKKVDFSIINEDLKEKNRLDVLKLGQIEDQKQIFPYYDEIRRLTLVEWEDMIWNSRLIDSLLLKEAKRQKIVLPMKPKNVEETDEEFQGAYRELFVPGRSENVWKVDLASAYPNAIIDFCLDTSNIHAYEGIEINGTKFVQKEGALLPTVLKKLMTLKDKIKRQLATTSVTDEDYKQLEISYAAIKGVVNSGYGSIALKYFRLFDTRIASSCTFLIRSLLHYVKDKIELLGKKVIYCDTDSLELFSENDPTEELNNLIQQWALEVFHKGQVNLRFSCEGKFEQILYLALCRYVGRLRKPSGELELETKGVECLDPESIIPSSVGPKKLKDLKINDFIYDSSGKLTSIIDVRTSQHNKYLEVYSHGKFPIKCSLNHRIFIMRDNNELLLPAEELKVGDYLLETPQIMKDNKIPFSRLLACVLGFFYSEGCIGENNLLRFTMHQKERRLLLFLNKLIFKFFRVKMFLYPSYNHSKAIVLQKQDVIFKKLKQIIKIKKDRGSFCKYHKLPTALLIAPKESIVVFLKALFTGDGCMCTTGSIIYETVSQDLFEDVKYLLKRCDIKFLESSKQPNLKTKNPSITYRLEIGKGELYTYYHQIGFYGEKENLLKQEITKKFKINKNRYNQNFKGLLLKKIKKIVLVEQPINLIDIETKSGEFLCNYLKVHNSKRKDSSNFIVSFQTELLNKILDNEPKEKIFTWIKEHIANFKNQPLKDIAFPCKLARKPIDYKNQPVFVRGMKATPEVDIKVGDSFYYIYMDGKDEDKKENVKIFTDDIYAHINKEQVCWQKMVERNIISKIETVFEAMKYDIKEVYEEPLKPSKRSKPTPNPLKSTFVGLDRLAEVLDEAVDNVVKTKAKKAVECPINDENKPKKGRSRPKKIVDIPLTSIKKDDIIKP